MRVEHQNGQYPGALTSPRRWLWIGFAVVIVASLSLVYVFHLPLRLTPSADQRAVESAFQSAIRAEMQVQATAVEPSNKPFLKADLPGQHNADRVRLAAFTVDPLFTRAMSIADLARDGQVSAPPATMTWVDAGVDGVTFNQVSVQGDHATVAASADVWFNFYARGIPPGTAGSGAPGHNGISYRADLVRSADGRWLVRDYTSNFLHGEGP